MNVTLGNVMNESLRTIRPSSKWISAGLLTLFVLSFGIFAESHVRANTHSSDAYAGYCTSDTPDQPRTLIRFH